MGKCQVGEEKCPLALWCLANGPLKEENAQLAICLQCGQRYIAVAPADYRSRRWTPRSFMIKRWPKCLGENPKVQEHHGSPCSKCFEEDL